MKNITLLPASYRKKVEAQRKSARIIFVLQICVVLAVIFCLAAFQMGNSYRAQQDACNQNITQLDGWINSYDNAVEMSDRVQQQRALSEQAQGDVPALDAIVVEIANNAPALIGINSMAVAYEGDQGAGVISGRADTHSDVSEWIEILQQNENLDNIRCSYTQQGSDANTGVTFELQFLVLADG